jgi:hypothetical protein
MVSLDVLNEMSGEQEMRQVEKNTFVDFQRVDSRSRRQTMTGGLVSLRRCTWDEEDISVKARPKKLAMRRARPGDSLREATRASTYAPGAAVKVGLKPQSCPSRPQATQLGLPQAPVMWQAPMVPVQQCFLAVAVPCFVQEDFKARETSMASTRAPSKESCMSMTSFDSSRSPSRSPSPAPFAQDGVWQPLTKESPQKKGKKSKPLALENEVTLMVRHLPLHYTPASLLQEVQAFMPNIDFFYLPTNFELGNNLGYAFFNFDDKAAAERFVESWKASGISTSKDAEAVTVQPSRLQGKAANVESFRNSSVLRVLPEYLKPQIFTKGVPQAFPKSDKALPRVCPRFRAAEVSA